MMPSTVVVKTDLPFNLVKKGKVRDMYAIDDHLLIIATDRISAFDRVLPDPIPSKGICLTQLSKFWFDYMKDIVPNHLVATEVDEFPEKLKAYRDIIAYRSMFVKKAKVIPIECVVRGYISGSAWKSYQKDGTVCGSVLRSGLRESEKFDEPLFTPSTKADTGHDINISFTEMKKHVGKKTAGRLRDFSINIYEKATHYAKKKGIIIADTKFEFGTVDGQIVLVDEVLTPDSSRFWPADKYVVGTSQPSFDKQFVRDYLERIGWDKNTSPPHLPAEIIRETQRKYQEAFERITGKKFTFQ